MARNADGRRSGGSSRTADSGRRAVASRANSASMRHEVPCPGSQSARSADKAGRPAVTSITVSASTTPRRSRPPSRNMASFILSPQHVMACARRQAARANALMFKATAAAS